MKGIRKNKKQRGTNAARHFNNFPLVMAGLILLCLLAVWGISRYQDIVTKSIHQVSSLFLEELSRREASHLERNLDLQFSALQLAESRLRTEAGESLKTLQTLLLELQTIQHYSFLALIDKEGNYITANVYEPAVSKINSLNQLLAGEQRLISFNETISGIDVVLLGGAVAPLYYGGQTFVAIAAGVSSQDFIQKMALKGSDSQTRTSIVNRQGVFVVYTPPEGGKTLGTNLFSILENAARMGNESSLQEIRTNFSKGEAGYASYELAGTQTLMYYMPVPTTHWFVVSEMPYAVLLAVVQNFLRLTVAIGALIIFVVTILLVSFMATARHARNACQKAVRMGAELAETRRQSQDALYQMAYYDELTKIANKNLFLKTVPEQLSLPGDRAYVLLDIRKFRVINELYGYSRGDLILRQVAELLSLALGEQEIAARFSADQFHVFLKYQGKTDLENRLFALAEQLGKLVPADAFERQLAIACGVYVADTAENAAISVEKMGDYARLALREIKEHSASEIAFFNKAIQERVMDELEIENDMHRALAEKQFVAFLQPKYHAVSGKISGAEALVRWQHPRRGRIFPDTFIPLFEKNGFIKELDMYMLETVFAQMRAWLDRGLTLVPVSINQSRLLLHSAGYIENLLALVEKYQIPPYLIEIEITESLFLFDKGRMLAIVEQLHQLGFTVSMDDFGSGYSTLNMLKEILVDTLKIDKDFFSENSNTERGRTIVANIITMAQALKLSVVAEGVETREQTEFLRKTGCNIFQGYFFAKPMPCDEFEKLLAKQ